MENTNIKSKELSSTKKYPVIKVPASGKSDWSVGARTLCFVYSKFDGNFILEGFHGEVSAYLKKNYTHYFYYISMWYNGKCRGYWKFWKNSVSIISPDKSNKIRKYKVVTYDKNYISLSEIKLKRLPKYWIKEFDNL